MLKCPICGKEYSYEGKICLECEDRSLYSGLVKKENLKDYTWNCAIFLDEYKSIFGVNKSLRHYLKLTTEPSKLKVRGAKRYEWNTDTAVRFKSCIEESLLDSGIKYDSELIRDILKVIEKKAVSSLIYE
ncbi:MAG: hypothetical protein ACFE85_18455 [Candidatus Hodarchaeota archaeon]